MEIFDHWWEYFFVIKWSLFPPNFNVFGKEKPPEKQYFVNKYTKQIQELSKNDKAIELFKEKLNYLVDYEEDCQKTIENKAHSIFSQTSLAVTLLITAISLFTLQSNTLSNIQIIVIYFYLLIISLNLITAGLLARNVIALNYFYTKQVIDDISEKYFKVDSFIEQIQIIEQSAYNNFIKATFLKFSHWYYKATFVCVFAFVATLFGMYIAQQIMSDDQQKIIVNSEYIENNKRKINETKQVIIDSLNLDQSTIDSLFQTNKNADIIKKMNNE